MLSTPELQAYIDLARGFEPKDAPYLQNHRGHLMFVKPEEKRFVTADLIRATSFTGGRSRDQAAHRFPCAAPATRSSPSSWCPARKRRWPIGAASARRSRSTGYR